MTGLRYYEKVVTLKLDGRRCTACGRCVEVCPQGAIELTIAGSTFVADSIARISPLVDVS